MKPRGFILSAKLTANSQSLPIFMYAGVLRLARGVAFDHGVHGEENQIRSGCGHLSKLKVSTSLHTALLRLACRWSLSIL